MIIEFQTQIASPPEKVFAYVADLDKHSDWSQIEEVRRTSDGPIAVGATYESVGPGPMGKKSSDTIEVTEQQPNERFAWRSAGGLGMLFNWSFELQSQDGGTLLIQRLDTPPGFLANAMLKLFAEKQMRKTMPEGLAKLKERVEAG